MNSSTNTSNIHREVIVTPLKRTAKILAWTAAAVFLVSLVATTTLTLLVHFQVLHNVSQIILYAPPGGAAGLSAILGLVSLAIKCCSPSVTRRVREPDQSASPVVEIKSKTPPPLTKKQISKAKKIDEKWLEKLREKKELHPAPEEEGYDFRNEPLRKLDSSRAASSCFLLLMADFMGLELDEYETNSSLSLSFLIRELSELKEAEIVEKTKLESLIKRFQTAYRFINYQNQLQSAPSLEAYQKGRKELSSRMLKTLEEEGSLLLDGGYINEPAGHTLTIEFTLEEGMVTGTVLNRGEGIGSYHSTKTDEKDKYLALELEVVSLEAFKESNYLDHITDFQMLNMLKSETEYETEKKTHYSIQDIYEVLLPIWPGTISTTCSKSHTQQHGGSCSIKAFVGLMKESLGKKDGNNAKVFLELKAFELLLAHTDFETLDLTRVEDALAKLNRSAVKLDRKDALDLSLKKQVLELSKEITKKIEKTKEDQKLRDRETTITLEAPIDESSYGISLALGTPMKEKGRRIKKEKVEIFKSLPPFKKHACSSYIHTAHHLVENAVKHKQLRYAKKIARQALLAIPNPSDSFWDTKRPEEEMRMLTDIVEILLKEQTRENKPIVTSANEATLYLKILTLSLKQAAMGGVPKEIVDLYGIQTKAALEKTGHLYRLTHPEYAKTFLDCHKVIHSFSGLSTPITLEKDSLNYWWKLEDRTFSSVSELRRDKELRFLNDFLQLHPELKETSWQGIINKENGPVENTLGLYKDSSFWDHNFRNITHESPNPKWEPVRQWCCLREMHYLFVCSSFLVGDVLLNLKDKSCSGYNFQFERHSYYGEAKRGIHHKVIALNYFKPKDPRDLSRGAFLDTFHTFSSSMKEKLEELVEPSSDFMGTSKKTQNEQLLFQEGIHFDEELDLTALEVQHLLSIQTHDELMVPQLISFFSRNFYRLKDPRFQALFSQFLFSLNQEKSQLILQKVMKSSSFVKYLLVSFLKSSLEKTETLGWFECQLFLLRTLAQTNRYLLEANPKGSLGKQATRILEKRMRALLENKGLTPEEMGKALYTLVSCAPYFDHFKTAGLIELCKAAKKEIQTKGYIGKIKKRHQWQEDFEVGDRLLVTGTEPKGMLPLWVVTHDNYIFERNFPVEEIGEGLYAFYDESGKLYRLATDGGSIRIYQKIEGQWYEHRLQSPFVGKGFPEENHPCAKGYFTRNIRVWYHVKEPKTALVISTESNQIVCRVKNDGIFHPTSKEPLTLTTNYATDTIEHFSRIASKSELLVWKNSENKVVRIEIPSFSLHFTLEKGKWKSPQYPGYFLDNHPVSPSLKPYTHYLVLKNRKGKRIAILPNFGVKAEKQMGLKKAKIAYTQITKSLTLLSLSLSKKGNIKVPENPESTLYLIYLSIRKHDYKLAKRLIHQVKREQPEWENTWCIWIKDLDLPEKEIEKKLDNHPEAVSLRLQLRLLMKELSSVKLGSTEYKGLKRDYFTYLDLRKNTFGVSLSQSEELKCLKQLQKSSLTFSEKESFQLAVRKHALDKECLPPEEATFTVPINAKKELPTPPSFLWIDKKIEKSMKKHIDQPVQVAFITRPGSALIHNMLYYYSIARHLDTEHPLHKQLQQLLRITRTMKDVKLNSIHTLLMNVVKTPGAFPTLGEILARKESLKEQFESLSPKLSHISHEEWSFQDKRGIRTHFGKVKRKAFQSTLPSTTPKILVEEVGADSFDFTSYLAELDYLVKQTWSERAIEINQELELLEEMEKFFNNCHDENPCVEREFTRLIEGIEEKKDKLTKELIKEKAPYQLNPKKIEELSSTLETLHSKMTKAISNKKDTILEIAHTYPEKLCLEKNGRMLEPLTLKELIIHFGTGNDEAIYTSNPSLTPEKLETLKTLIAEYLILSTDLNQVIKMQSNLEDKNEFIKHATAIRVYDPIKEPHLLVFEHFGKIRLRKEQYKALMKMTGTEEDIELEARTGFGKSKVLIPLWLFLKSQKENTAMMTVPSSLFIAQHTHLKKILGKAYDSLIVPIQFNRSKANDPKYLKRLCAKLEDARRNKKIVLTTIQALHGMTSLKLKESLASGTGKTETKMQKQLLKLHEKIATQIADFFDESKVCFNIRHRYDYAVGALSSVDPEQITSACSVYRNFLFKSALLENFNLEFLPAFHAPEKITPLQENYEKELLPLLAENIITRFKVPEKLRKFVLADLQGHYSIECEEFYKTLSISQLEAYDQYKKQLTIHLRRTLFRKCDDGYGFYPGTRLAIPFLDGAAKKSSEFSEVEDYIDFTIQANLKKPFSQKDIEIFIDHLKIKFFEAGLSELETTAEYQLLTRLTKIPLMKLEDHHYKEIAEIINEDIELKFDFIEHAVLPQIKIYKKKITSTSFNLIRAIHHLQAASGTVNPDMLPPRLTTEEDKTAVIGNLMALWKNSQNRIFTLSSGTAEKQLKKLLTQRTKESVLIDVAGTFRDLTPETTAKTILKARPELKGVVLYNDEGRELVYEKESQMLLPVEESLLDTEELFIFIRKSKAIGTDTNMSLTAGAIVTVDRDSYRDFVLQGTGRMRKLTEGQIAGFAVSNEDAKIIFGEEKMQFKHLVSYIVRNQGKQKGEDAFYVLRLYLEDLIDASFWDAARTLTKTEDVQILFKTLEQFLVKETQTKPLVGLRKERTKLPATKAVKQLKKDVLEPIAKFCKENETWAHLFNLETMEKKFDAFVDYEKLPKEISMYGGEDGTSTVEAEVSAEAENIQEEVVDQISDMELENEDVSEKVTDLPGIRFKPGKPLDWNGDYVSLFKGLIEKELLDIPIFQSPNFARVSKELEENKRIQKPAYQYLVHINDAGEMRVMLLDLYDAKTVLNKMLSSPVSSKTDNYYLMSGTQVIAHDGMKPLLQLDSKNPSVRSLNLIRKLYVAHTNLTKKEKKHFSRVHKGEYIKEANRLNISWPHLTPLIANCKAALTI